MGDLAFEAEQLGGQRVQVNRVAVTGDSAVATAGVAGNLPFHGIGGRLRLGRIFLLAAATAAAAEEVHRFAFPDALTTGADAGEDGELVALVYLGQVAQETLHVQLLALADRAVLGDAVAHVHQAHGREREAVAEDQGHMQREGVHVWVGHRQLAVGGEATDLAVGRQVFFIQCHVVQTQADVRQGGVAARLHGGAQDRLGEVDHHGGRISQFAEFYLTHYSILSRWSCGGLRPMIFMSLRCDRQRRKDHGTTTRKEYRAGQATRYWPRRQAG